MNTVAQEPRRTRYIILVDGEVASAFGQRIAATKRARIISKTWSRWQKIEMVDSWHIHPRLTIAKAS